MASRDEQNTAQDVERLRDAFQSPCVVTILESNMDTSIQTYNYAFMTHFFWLYHCCRPYAKCSTWPSFILVNDVAAHQGFTAS